jgi:hypothetical protein
MSILYNQTAHSIYGKGRKTPAIGIEVEMEPIDPLSSMYHEIGQPEYWKFKEDGSLRNGIEAVSVILGFDEVGRALQELGYTVNWNNITNSSPRTSVHVHINVGCLTYAQIVNLYCIYLLVEDLLLELSGKSRMGNNFALSSQVSDSLDRIISHGIRQNELFFVGMDERYGSFNLAPVTKFGTVEFRSMRGLNNIDDISQWVQIIKELFIKASSYETLSEMLKQPKDNLFPESLGKFFSKERILETVESNYSRCLVFIYDHKTQWDFSDTSCDIRENNEFVKWLIGTQGFTEKTVLTTHTEQLRVRYKKYEKRQSFYTPDFVDLKPYQEVVGLWIEDELETFDNGEEDE